MRKDEQYHVSLEENFFRRAGNWQPDDVRIIVVFCEAFEVFDFDALYRLASYVMLPSINKKGIVERQVFELEFSFGRKMLQIVLIDEKTYLLSD